MRPSINVAPGWQGLLLGIILLVGSLVVYYTLLRHYSESNAKTPIWYQRIRTYGVLVIFGSLGVVVVIASLVRLA